LARGLNGASAGAVRRNPAEAFAKGGNSVIIAILGLS
jgi:hypothetical protein